MTRTFERLHETVQSETLENGLRVCYLPRPGFSKTFAVLATQFGSVDASFTLDSVRHDTPAGVAHFLEHKMFEEEDGNALQKLGATGASPNAFTSHTMTAYYFSCTDQFEENLKTLLHFVYTPYFTDQNVEKEKGIIGQEIRMMEDNPDWMAYVGLFQALYHTHPVRTSIAGSVESIAEIDPAVLHLCHRAFYSPSNMVLVVCGTADFDRVLELARQGSPAQAVEVAERHYGVRQPQAASDRLSRRMAVSQPIGLMGFKDVPLMEGETWMRRQLTAELSLRILCGNTSALFARLYADGLIDRRFETSYMQIPEGALAICGGETRDPDAVRAQIEAEAKRLAEEGIDDALFERMKRANYGLNVRLFDHPDELCRAQAESMFGGSDFAEFAEISETLTAADVQETLRRWTQPGRTALSVVEPLTE